jgi:hypothetical protein
MPYTGAFSSEFATVLTLCVPKMKMRQHGCRSALLYQDAPTEYYSKNSVRLKVPELCQLCHSAKHPHINSYKAHAVPSFRHLLVDFDRWAGGGGADFG